MLFGLELVLAASMAAGGGQAEAQGRSEALAPFIACRQVAEPAARLQCFEQATAGLEAAVAEQRIVVLNRDDIRRTRRSLFGLSRPRLQLLEREGEEEAAEEINGTIRSARSRGNGRWAVTLEDDAVWVTTEAYRGIRDPRAGAAVRIRRGPFNSYMMNIEGQRGVRVMRER